MSRLSILSLKQNIRFNRNYAGLVRFTAEYRGNLAGIEGPWAMSLTWRPRSKKQSRFQRQRLKK